ncbi:hypothetical protein QYE76_036623 [Lolium multiflorum]|uniref:RNase H type-1 domain-containing protein n=1 Tax=Lolium multiflorum TaxID=4521 RepID=A0AAD8VQ53_LOLMU|nr:hypothetical protein QYE76_036623 [Lolium multiflorum]
MRELPKEDSALDREKSKPTQSAPEQEIKVEDQCRSAWVSQVLEKQRCHFLHFLAHTTGTAPQEAGAGPEQVEAPENNAAPNQHEAVGESSAPAEESILGNLSPISGDTPSMDTEEFDRKVKEYGYGDQPEVESAQPKQVLATLAALDQRESEDENTQSDPQPSHAGSPLSWERPRKEVLSPEELVEQAGMDAIAHSDILNKPITPEDALNAEALEAKRIEMLATAQKFAQTAAAMIDERKEAANFVDNFLKREREVDESLVKVKQLRKHWEDKITEAQQEVDKIRRETIDPRKITFATPTEQQPYTTLKDNMKKAAEILKKKDEEIDIDYVCTLVASAMKQQSKADTSRKLESNPEHCISTAQKNSYDNRHRDDESQTGSSERRRKTREHPNPISVPSKTPPSDPRKGKDAMYTGTGSERRNLAGARSMIASLSPGAVGTKNATRSLAEAGTAKAASTRVKAAIEAGANIAKGGESQKVEAKGRSAPSQVSHHLAVEAEVEAEAVVEISRAQNPPQRCTFSASLDLEKKSIFCWFDLKTAFEKHFRGTYKRPATTSDLQACIQKKGETSRHFFTRWLACRNECKNIDNRTAMHAFIGGLQRGGLLRHKLTCLVNANKLTLDDMITIASDHTAADDDAGGDLPATSIPLHQQKKNRDNGNSSGNKRKNPPDNQKSGGSEMVAVAFQRGGQGGGRGRGRGGEDGRGQQRGDEVENLRRYKMMLNPLKCVFGVPVGKLLVFIVSNRGIEVNPEKIKAILCIKRPTYLKDVQRLTGCVAAISRFVSRLGEKALPLYKLLKKTDKFVWDEAADAALQGLKEILTSPPILPAPGESEPMLLYLAATNRVISLVIVVERQEEGHEYGVQRPVYYISEVLTESKQRYPHFQKLAYGVFLGSRKLRHYFQEHPVTVVSKAPLSTILNNADATGRTTKWGIELSAFDINYKARTAIKSQILADFVADWTEAPDINLELEPETWVMHFDGSNQHQGSGAGVTLKSPTGEELQYVLQIHFEATNNMAEYEALLHGLRIAKEIGIKHIICCGDSDLVAQIAGTWNAETPSWRLTETADEIAKCFLIQSQGANPVNPEVAVSLAREVMVITPAWTQPFLDYLIDEKLPEDEVLARQIIRRARSYTIVDGQLYKRNTTGVFLKCVSSQDGIEILREIHAGDCGHHAAPRSLVAKAFRLGFYWLTAKEDADKLVKTCRGCQYYATQPNAPAQELKTIPITWPFAVWGLDMVGKLKRSSPGGFEYLLVAVDKFGKWIEAKPRSSAGVLHHHRHHAVVVGFKRSYYFRCPLEREVDVVFINNRTLESDLQKRFEHHDPHEFMKELKAIFETHAAVECYEASKQFFTCMMEEGSSVSEHMLAMTGHAKKLSDLGIVIPNRLGINRVLQSPPPSYKNFVMNYNMQNMNKELPELFGMLKAAEIEIKKEHQVLMVNKTTSFKKQASLRENSRRMARKLPRLL